MALIKSSLRHLPPPAIFNWIFRGYLVIAALGGTLAYFFRIRKLPLPNQVLCLCIATVWLPPVSYDYTLMHLYLPFAMLILIAADRMRQGESTRSLVPVFLCFAVLFAPESELLKHGEGFAGDLKSLTLGVLFFLALRTPFTLNVAAIARGLEYAEPA